MRRVGGALWARVCPRVCGIALREIPRVAVTGQRREDKKVGWSRIHALTRVARRVSRVPRMFLRALGTPYREEQRFRNVPELGPLTH